MKNYRKAKCDLFGQKMLYSSGPESTVPEPTAPGSTVAGSAVPEHSQYQNIHSTRTLDFLGKIRLALRLV